MSGISTPGRYGIVGSGWRSELFLRLARALPDHLAVAGVVTRTAERGDQVTAEWGVPTFRTVEELVSAQRPDFVIVSVPWSVAPDVTRRLVELAVPVLTETPPAPDIEGLRSLWSQIGPGNQVQVAEQYLLYPGHASRLALARSGVIGQVSSVQVSSTHQYHAVSMIRGLLGVGFEPAAVTAHQLTAPLADPVGKNGWTDHAQPRPLTETVAWLDFGKGRAGLYDFTENQWFNPLRFRRIVVRGSLGEIADDTVVRLLDEATAITSTMMRRQTGVDLNLEGADLDHISFEGAILYRNPWQGARLSDDEVAVATLLTQMTAFVRGAGEPPYPLADACQDHLLALAVDESLRTGATVVTTPEAWTS